MEKCGFKARPSNSSMETPGASLYTIGMPYHGSEHVEFAGIQQDSRPMCRVAMERTVKTLNFGSQSKTWPAPRKSPGGPGLEVVLPRSAQRVPNAIGPAREVLGRDGKTFEIRTQGDAWNLPAPSAFG